jgi:hypothetical protein
MSAEAASEDARNDRREKRLGMDLVHNQWALRQNDDAWSACYHGRFGNNFQANEVERAAARASTKL